MLSVASELDRSRFAPALVVLDAEGPLASAAPADVPVTTLAAPRLRHALPALYRTLRRMQPDVVLSTMGYLNLAVLAAGRLALAPHARILVREANQVSATLNAFPSKALGRFAYRRLYRKADAVLCNSSGVARELAEVGVPPQSIKLIGNPIDTAALRRRATGAEQTPGRFVAAGRLMRQKGFDRLVDWFAAMPEAATLTIFGEGPERPSLEARIAAAGLAARIDLPGYVPEIWRQLAGADAFLMPSRWEGMPNAALEALALGVPVIATEEAGGLKELRGEAPGDRLLLAEDGAEFVSAMRSAIRTEPIPPGLRDSALPARFSKPVVVAQYAALMAGET